MALPPSGLQRGNSSFLYGNGFRVAEGVAHEPRRNSHEFSKESGVASPHSAGRPRAAHLLDELDPRLQRTGHPHGFDATVELAERDEPARMAKVPVEQGQIPPGGVVGDVSG